MSRSNPRTTDRRELARRDLAAYGAAMWPPLELAPHIKAVIDELERVESGLHDRVMLFLPPRHGKSLITSQIFPAWYLGCHPDRSIIASSYGQELASDFGWRVRGFVTDQLHTTIFPECLVADDSNAVHRFGLTAGGAYFAVGAGGPITGRGADLLLIDDAVKSREQAYSAAERKSLQQWYEHVAYTRLQPGGAIIIIVTRWHEDDLPGWLLREHAREAWKTISLPAIAEPADLLGRKEGEPLWIERFGLETLDRIREAVGTAAGYRFISSGRYANTAGLFTVIGFAATERRRNFSASSSVWIAHTKLISRPITQSYKFGARQRVATACCTAGGSARSFPSSPARQPRSLSFGGRMPCSSKMRPAANR